MTLDEAIKHCLEVAEKNECKMTSDDGYTDVSMKQCAADHRQLAEWLTELKHWRENPFKMIKDICANQFDCCNCPIGGYCRADDWFGYPSDWEVE